MSTQLEPTLLFQQEYGTLLLACPVCGDNYTHILRAWSLEGADPDEPEGRPECGALYGIAVGGVSAERRGALVIQAYCESGHLFRVHFQQHKGNTFLEAFHAGEMEW